MISFHLFILKIKCKKETKRTHTLCAIAFVLTREGIHAHSLYSIDNRNFIKMSVINLHHLIFSVALSVCMYWGCFFFIAYTFHFYHRSLVLFLKNNHKMWCMNMTLRYCIANKSLNCKFVSESDINSIISLFFLDLLSGYLKKVKILWDMKRRREKKFKLKEYDRKINVMAIIV